MHTASGHTASRHDLSAGGLPYHKPAKRLLTSYSRSQSAYTYAVELSIDEVEEQGAKGVTFSQPVSYFVDNFIGMPVGTTVPAGYYDLDLGAWVPDRDGVVIAIVNIASGQDQIDEAEIDLTGDGLAESATVLDAAGLTIDKRRELATQYAVGTELWYVQLLHFTAWDLNYAWSLPLDACVPLDCDPNDPAFLALFGTDNPACQSGSVIECENQVLHESTPVAGTPFSLTYSSNRVPGGQAPAVTFPVTGPSIPASVMEIHAYLTVAGRTIAWSQQCPCDLNNSVTLDWDGLDALGRTVTGTQPAQIAVAYVYDALRRGRGYNGLDRTFGALVGEASFVQQGAGDQVKIDVVLRKNITIDNWNNAGQGLGGFAVDAVHGYDPLTGTLWRGDGSRRHQDRQNVIDIVMVAPPFGFQSIAPMADGSVIYYAAGQRRCDPACGQVERQPPSVHTRGERPSNRRL